MAVTMPVPQSRDAEVKRSGGRFVKGTASANPGGRPKGYEGFREWLKGTREVRQKALIELMASDNEKVRLAAVQHADAYDYGRPQQTMELTGDMSFTLKTNLGEKHA